MTDDERNQKRSQRAVQRFFMGVGRAGAEWRDENTMPLFPLRLIVDPEMLEADAIHEAKKRG